MKLNASIAVAAAIAVALIAAGCGSSSSGTTTTSLTKTEWIAKADAICAKGNQETNTAAQQQFGNQQPTAAQINDFASKTVVPNIQSQVDQIKALGAPSEIQSQVNHLISTVQADLDKLKSDPSALQNKQAFTDANAAAKGLGLKVCGSNGG